MTLSAGTRLGPYEILSLVGSGGMGEVYRARDPKLKRDVAIKVLPDSLARDPERLARFEREAHLLAALNHPHIAQIHGFEDSTATPALVMELVDGPTLAELIARGPIPMAEALPMARQIAGALEAAHQQGIVHRDLKPANIKVRTDGTVKVLDFGLAKALTDATQEVGATSLRPSASLSPTLTAPTQLGVILGTAAYMSPEQARGRSVDKRTDIWSFGCVLFEMLTATQAFAGPTGSDSLARILEREPAWDRLPADTPAAIRRLLRRSLQKEAHQRLHDIADARIDIDEAMASPHETPEGSLRTPSWRRTAIAAVAGIALTAIAMTLLS